MNYNVLRRFLFSTGFLFLAANTIFAQVPVRRSISSAPILKSNQKVVIFAKPVVRPLRKKLPTKIFGVSHAHELLKYHTTTSGNKTKIVFDIELGEPLFKKSKVVVIGSDGKQFGNPFWGNLNMDKLPSGVSYSTTGKTGEPEIPSLSVMIAIPENAGNITPFIQQNTFAVFTNAFLLPKPDVKKQRSYSAKIYRSPQSSSVLLSPSAKIRTMRIVSLTIPLVEFTASSGTIKAKKKFSCGITFDVQSQITSTSFKNNTDPVFAQLYSKLAANTSDIERFRSGFHNHMTGKIQAAGVTPTFDKSITNWIDPVAPYIKLAATRTGLYRVTAAEAGITNWQQSEVRMFNRGKEVPIWIDSSKGNINAIEYYGERLAGYPGEYYNWDSDSNAYWLTNSQKFQTPPKRYTDKVIPGNPTQNFSEGNITLHHEQDNFYYGGDAGFREDSTLQRFEWVPGERFVWSEMRDSTTTVIDTFNISALPVNTSGKTATILIFLRGMSSNSSSVTHDGTIAINGVELPDVSFNDFNELRTSFTINLSQLRVGANTFKIAFKPGNGNPDQWYFDYYEISFGGSLAASSDTAIAKGQWAFTIAPTLPQFSISLQTSGEVPHLFNLTNGSKLIGNGSIYNDDASDTSKYAAAISTSFLHPDRIVNASGSFASILDSTTGADYIIITHPMFMQTALTLAKRRHDFSGLRTKVVSTDEVFNAFDFGSDEPWAIRRYLQYAYDFYAGAPPSFVTLFGEGTWDPKFILNNPLQDNQSKTIHRSLVPTFGVPSSDYVFTTVEDSPTFEDSSTFRMIISRIPAETPDDAQNFLNKLVEYETSAPAAWNKNFLFISGGDAGLQASDLAFDEHLFVGDSTVFPPGTNDDGGLGNPPISIHPTFIPRVDFADNIDIMQIAAIQTAFRAGQSLVYFFGHGAPNITDVQFPDVGTLGNQGEYPILITVSCRTGAFAEPNIISMNESFIRVPEAGAILAFGTTGFGEVDYDFNMSAQIFNFMRADSSFARMPFTGAHKINIPIIFTTAKFIQSILLSSSNAEQADFGPHNSLYEYAILGDAAMGFDLRPQPEFNITPPDILLLGKDSLPRTVFSLSDSEITVKATIHNFGYGITSPVHVRITDDQPGNRQVILIDTITTLENIATTGAVFSLDSFAVGQNTLDVFVDYDNLFAETNENDNGASVNFLVNGVSGTPFYPPEGSKFFCDIRSDSVNFILLLPNKPSGTTSIEMQFDITPAFTSPKIFTGLIGSGLFFQKAFSRSVLPNPSSNVIWWRSRITLQNGNQSAWQVQSFSLDAPKPSGARSEFSYSTGDQLGTTIVSGLQVDKSDGALFIPTNDTVHYEIDAQGGLNTNVVPPNPIGEVFIDGRPAAYITPDPNGVDFNGVALLELTGDGSGIDSVFEFNNPDNNDSLLRILAVNFAHVVSGFPNGRGAIVLTNRQGFMPSFSAADTVTAALQSLGSLKGMGAVQYFGSYALIGKKGLSPGLAKENFGNPGFSGAKILDTIITLGTSGVAQTPLTSVSTGYGNLKWNAQNISAGSTIKFTVLGVQKSTGNIDTVLIADASSGTSANLSAISSLTYDKLAVRINFQRNTSTTNSPRLNLIELEYDPAPEFTTNDSLITVLPKISLEGNPVLVTYQVQNVTCIDAQKVPVQLVQTYHGKASIIATDTIANFPGHSSVSFTHSIPTTGFQGNVNLTATVNPGGVLNEQLAFNNFANTFYTVVRDSAKPKLDLLFDGSHISSGDYVSSKVVIEIRLSDNSPLRVTDSSSISGVLQGLTGVSSPQNFTGNKITASFMTRFITLPSGQVQAVLDITPDSALKPGRYLFTAMGNDASGNRADTISDEFVISGTNGLDHVMNYPNPFKDMTWFTFILKSGSQADVKVVIYTVAGRKIRTLHLDPAKQRAGLNSIQWDGRDEMNNDVANGTYLYRVVLNGTNDDGSASSDATTERAVRSR